MSMSWSSNSDLQSALKKSRMASKEVTSKDYQSQTYLVPNISLVSSDLWGPQWSPQGALSSLCKVQSPSWRQSYMAFKHKKESVLKTKDLRKLISRYLKSKFLPGVTAHWTRHPNIPVSCLAKKNNYFCHPDRKHSQLESLKQRGSRICNLTSFFCAWHCGYNLGILMSTLSSS